MFERLIAHQEALVVIIIALAMVGLLFVCQFIAPLVLWTIRKLTPTAYSGEEIVKILQEENQTNINVKEANRFWFSAYNSYNKRKETVTFSKVRLKRTDVDTIFKILLSFVFMNEKQNKISKFSWQLMSLIALSVLQYLIALAILLLIYLPDLEVFNNGFGLDYLIAAQALGIISFVLIIVIASWWSYALKLIQQEINELLNKIQNRSLHALVLNHYKTCSFIPFSLRLLI